MKRNVCECGSTDLTGASPADAIYRLRDGKWLEDGCQEYNDSATISCNRCGASWEEWLEDDNDVDDNPLPGKCYFDPKEAQE